MALPVFDLEPEYAILAEMPLEAPAGEDGGLNVEEALDALSDEIAPKLLALARVVRTLDAEADVLEEHARALNARANSRRRRVDFFKRWMRLQMESAGIDKVKDAFISMWLQVSPPSVDVIDETAVPPEFQRAVLRLPYSLVPSELRGFLQHLDVERSAILNLAKRTGNVPDGVAIRTDEKHLRIRT